MGQLNQKQLYEPACAYDNFNDKFFLLVRKAHFSVKMCLHYFVFSSWEMAGF